MGEATADRATVAHLDVADIACALREQPEVSAQQGGGCDLNVAYCGADTDLATLLGNLAEFRDAGYVDQMARLAQAQLENR